MPRTMALEVIGATMVLAHNDLPPDDAEWADFVAKSTTVTGILVITSKSAPNQLQRNRAREVWRERPPRIAVMTDSSVVQGVLSVLALFLGMAIKGFAPTDEAGACRHALVPEEQERAVRDGLARVRGAMMRVPAGP